MFPKSIGGFELRNEDNPETYIVVVVVRVVVVAIGRAAILSVVVPTAATNHSVRAFQPASILSNNCFLRFIELACRVKAINGKTCLAY